MGTPPRETGRTEPSRPPAEVPHCVSSVGSSIHINIYIYIIHMYILAESQKPPGLLSIGADEGVRIHILSGRACKTYVKLIWNIDFYVGGTYVMRMWSVCAAQVKTYVSRMWNICETYAKYMWHINVFWDCIALCLCFTYVYVCEFVFFFLCRRKNKTLFCANHAK